MFNFNLDEDWSSFINKNAKWSVGIFIRVSSIIILISLSLALARFVGLRELVGSSSQTEQLNIHTTEIINETQPSKLTYKKDVDEINSLIEKLNKRKNDANLGN